jgi:putative ABC transport system permease protein
MEQFAYDQRARTDDRCRFWGARPSVSVAYRPEAGVVVDDDGHTVALLTGTPDHQVAAALASGTVVVWDRNLIDASGSVHGHLVNLTTGASGPPFTLPATLAHSLPGLGVPVLPTSVASGLGLTVTPDAYLAKLTRPTSFGAPDTLTTLARRLDRIGDWTLTVDSAPDSSVAATLIALMIAAMLVALVGTLTSVGLAQVEGRADAATLSAVGAGAGVRRRLAAMQALTIAGLGTLLGLAGGLGAGWGMVQLRLAPAGTSMGAVVFDGGSTTAGLSSDVWSLVVPWPQLVVGTVGLVVIAMAVAFASTRSTLPLERRLAT